MGRVENIAGKGENAGYQHFLLFPQCFQKLPFPEVLKVGIVWLRVNQQKPVIVFILDSAQMLTSRLARRRWRTFSGQCIYRSDGTQRAVWSWRWFLIRLVNWPWNNLLLHWLRCPEFDTRVWVSTLGLSVGPRRNHWVHICQSILKDIVCFTSICQIFLNL